MISSQASADLNEQPQVMQVAMISDFPINSSQQQASSSVQTVMKGAVTMATVQIPQMRVLQAIASRPGQPQQFQQTIQAIPHHQPGQAQQQIQILKPVTGGGDMVFSNSISTMAGIKPAFGSPGKGAAVVTIPGAKMVPQSHIPTKLKVGDTIVIPAKALNKFTPTGSTSGAPVVIKQEQLASNIVFTTPTKLIPGTAAKSPMIASPATPHQTAQIRYITPQQATTPSQNLQSPIRLTTISPSWTPSPSMRYKRAGDYGDQDMYADNIKKARRTPTGTEKGSKGLRHFAMLVCEKVKRKITTTYNEVADELVADYSKTHNQMNDQQYDQKNIRRRVYDALNVLMAMNIIYKDKKDIHWVGLPTNSVQELQALQEEKRKREQKVQQKTAQLHELILQQIAFKNLVQRNKRLQQTVGPPASNSAIQLPFIIVNTSKKTVIDCSISNDKYEYLFNFDNTFEIHDDIEVLKRMGMAYGLEREKCSAEDLRTAKSLVPPVLRPYLDDMAGLDRQSGSLTASTSLQSSSSLSMESGMVMNPNSGTCTTLSGNQLLGSIKPDPEDQEVAMVVAQCGDSQQSSASSLTMSGQSSSRSSSVDVMGVPPGQSPALELPNLSSSLSPAAFDT